MCPSVLCLCVYVVFPDFFNCNFHYFCCLVILSMCITHSEYSFPQPSVFPFSSFFNWKRKNQKNHSQIPDRHLSVNSHGYCLFLWRKLQIQMFPSSSLTLTSVSSLYVLAEFHSTGRHHSEIIYGLQTSPKVIYTLQPPNSPAKPENPKLAETVVN